MNVDMGVGRRVHPSFTNFLFSFNYRIFTVLRFHIGWHTSNTALYIGTLRLSYSVIREIWLELTLSRNFLGGWFCQQ